MKIVIVTQYFRPENSKIPNAVARVLAERGHDVRVLTGYPNYPDGRLYAGFRQTIKHTEHDGDVTVRRVPLVISHSQNALGRLANYATFALSSLTAGRFVRDADVIYVYATPMTAAFAPSIWSRTRRIPFVLHVQDLWPESVTGSSMVRSRALRSAINAMLTPWISAVYRRSAAVIAIAPTMQRILLERGVKKKDLQTILNWADEQNVTKVKRPGYAASGLRVVYAGNLGHLQDLETVIEAVRAVSDLEGFRLVIVGSGIAETRLRQAAQGLVNVEFMGRVPIEQMNEIYEGSDFQLVTLRDLPIFKGTIPSKLQGSLAAGVPVITTVAGDVSDLVESAGVGIVARPENAQSLADAFRRAYDIPAVERRGMAAKASEYYLASMSMAAGIDQIEQTLRIAAAGRKRLKA